MPQHQVFSLNPQISHYYLGLEEPPIPFETEYDFAKSVVDVFVGAGLRNGDVLWSEIERTFRMQKDLGLGSGTHSESFRNSPVQ